MERRIQPASQNGLSTPYRSERQGGGPSIQRRYGEIVCGMRVPFGKHGKSFNWSDVPLRGWQTHGLGQAGPASHPTTRKTTGMGWYGWHGFRRGIASNLYELEANEKVVQRIVRNAKSHVTKDRYIKAFDPAVLSAMRKVETSLDAISQSAPRVHQIQ